MNYKEAVQGYGFSNVWRSRCQNNEFRIVNPCALKFVRYSKNHAQSFPLTPLGDP